MAVDGATTECWCSDSIDGATTECWCSGSIDGATTECWCSDSIDGAATECWYSESTVHSCCCCAVHYTSVSCYSWIRISNFNFQIESNRILSIKIRI